MRSVYESNASRSFRAAAWSLVLNQKTKAGRDAVSFNVNALSTGVVIAAVLSAIGFSESDPVVQWYVPAGILVVSIAWGVLRPAKRPTSRTQVER